MKEDNCNKITENIWLGNKDAALDYNFLKKNNIKRIINVTPNIPFSNFKNIKYLRIPIETFKYTNTENKFNHIITDCNTFNKYNILVYHFIKEAQLKNYNVLIHCRKGHTRSAIVLLYYLFTTTYNNKNIIIKDIQNKRNNTFKNYTYILNINNNVD